MKRMATWTPRRKNRLALILCAAALALVLVLLSLPVYTFSTAVYTKRSSNTFVGDEKYVAARAEAEAAAAEYEGAEIQESVTERVNSKGETTSLVVLNVVATQKLNAWQLMGAGFTPSWVLVALAACALLSAALAAISLRGALSTEHRRLAGGAKGLRLTACWLALIALLLTPIFVMTANYTFSREVGLMLNGFEVPNAEALRSGLDALLYDGAAGGELDGLLKSLTTSVPATIWGILAALLLLVLGQVLLYKGELKPTVIRGLLYLCVIALCVFILYPFFVMLITGFRSNAETTDMYFTHIMPTQWIWQNIPDIVNRGVLRYLGNSILLSTGATLIAMLCGIPAAYAMARMQFKGKKVFLGFVIMSQMFAPVVLLVGISQLMHTLRLNDTITGLMLINAAFNQAFAIWLLRGTFVSISSEMEQAACIDGCNTFSALVRILLPMAAPGIVTTLIFVFINAWNEYTISTVLITTPSNKPITVGITQFSSFNMIEWQYLFASALLATIPVVILFMCIEKHLVSGLTSGGVKG